MEWWILEERDTHLRRGRLACHAERIPPFNTEPSTAVCPKCSNKLEPDYWAPPRKAKLSASTCGDLIQGAGFELIISTGARDAFRGDGLKGLERLEPIALVPTPSMSYVLARPRVTVTRLREAASGITWRRAPACEVCRLGVRESVEKVVLDESTWDGSDIFMASGFYGAKIVTARFVESVERHKLTNFRFIQADRYSDTLGRLPDELDGN